MRFNASEVSWESVVVCDTPMLFSELRIDRASIPEGSYMYEVRHADDDWGEPVQIAKWVMVNHFGTLLSAAELPLQSNPQGNNAYLDIDPELEWGYEGFTCPLEEYCKEYTR